MGRKTTDSPIYNPAGNTNNEIDYPSREKSLPSNGDEVKNKHSNEEHHVGLKKEINLLYLVCICSGIMVGSGIFVSPVSITYNCGSIGLSLIVWCLSGLLMMFAALSYVDMAVTCGSAGAEFTYYKHCLGDLPAFLYAWYMFVLVNPAFFALLALTTGIYLVEPLFRDCDPPKSAIILIAIWTIVSITFLNSVYVRYVARVQVFFTAVKFIALIVICVAGIAEIAKGNTANLDKGFEGTTNSPGAISIAMYSGVFTYGGWQYLYPLLEEVKNPNKNIPLAIIISFVVVIIVYFFTNLAYLTVLTPTELYSSEAVAVTFAEKVLGGFAIAIPVFVACSTMGSLNGSILGGSRIYFAAARDNMFPEFMAMISLQYSTPIPSVIVTCILSTVYVLTGNAITLLECLGFAGTFNCLVTISIVIYQRLKHPEMPRAVHIPLWIPITADIVLAILTILGFIQQPINNGLGILLILTGIPVYLLGVVWKKPKSVKHYLYSIDCCVQKLLTAVRQDDYDSSTILSAQSLNKDNNNVHK